MSYILYTDKPKLFECQIKLQGAKLNETIVRLVLENQDYNLMFYGQIDKDGTCKVPIKKLRNLIDENSTGNIKLEVIAEDTYFTPWQDEFNIKASKAVTVEVKDSNNKNKVVENKKSVQITNINDSDSHMKPLMEQLTKMGMTYKSVLENKKSVFPIITKYFTQLGVNDVKIELNKFMKLLKNN